MIFHGKLLLLVITLCVLLALTGCSSSVQHTYQDGEALMEQGNFEEASLKFMELGSYEDASRLLMYCRAASAAENGEYDSAYHSFTALGEYRDAPEMLLYYHAREAESNGRVALESDDFSTALHLLKKAAEAYGTLSIVRDAEQREKDCLGLLYKHGLSLIEGKQYSIAFDTFTELDTFQDSQGLRDYCKACLLEEESAYLEAAEVFSEIPEILDAAERADSNRDTVYQQALTASSSGDQEAAISLFSALGSYRDAETQKNNSVRLLIQDRLKHSDYEGALLQLDSTPGVVSLQETEPELRQNYISFLDDFVEAYLHFSAGSMDSVSGYYGVLPFIRQGGSLERRFYQVLLIGSYSHNSYFNYYGSELLDFFRLDENCYLAYIRASASVVQPIGPVEVTRTFRILLHDTDNGPVAETIEDCLYGEDSKSGRPVISGPLSEGALPPDEDGDGIILVDIMKKGFNGTMIIVLDPSRVFVGGPGFYGGSGMLLEDLVRRYDALGGINGGGFIDEDGGGSGGLPEGLTIVDGQSYHWAGSGASAAFDDNNILHVGYFTQESAAEAGIRDCVSFGPALIVDGVPEYGSYMESGINPRTAIGQREDGAVLLLCVDGRQIHSIGANFADIRDVMLDFGAINACSLDGGSSTVMYYNGEYLNSPSSASGTSRYLPNAFLIRK